MFHIGVSRLIIFTLVASALSACATTAPLRDPANPPPHPLLGLKVWAADGQVMTPFQVDRVLSDTRYLLLGESHDNPTHHRLQARIIAEQAGPTTHVVFEMFDDASLVSDFNAGKDISERWNASGWPPYETYAPIFEALFETGAKAYAGNPPRDAVKAVVKGRLEALEASERVRLGLGQTLSEDDLSAMEVEMEVAD